MARPLIMVVDDETDVANSIAAVIKDTQRYDVITAYSAKEALEHLKKNKVMMGLGGEGSVRGFDTYDLVGDCGWNVTNEVGTRYWRLGLDRHLRQTPLYRCVRPVEDELQVFGFFDIGGVWRRNAVPFCLEDSYESISGMGIGCRYNFGPWIYLRAAYGWQLDDLLLSSLYDEWGRAHIMATISR